MGLHVVTLTRLDQHVDNADYIVTAAFKDIHDSALNLLFVNVRTVHTTPIGVGHFIDKSDKGR